MKDFEELFNDFLDGAEYDQAEGFLFTARRMAFQAGWMAAGGEPPKGQNLAQLYGARYMCPRERAGDKRD